MSKARKATVSVKGTDITVLVYREQDYISLTDIARHKNAGLDPQLAPQPQHDRVSRHLGEPQQSRL